MLLRISAQPEQTCSFCGIKHPSGNTHANLFRFFFFVTCSIDPEPVAVGSWRDRFVNSCKASLGEEGTLPQLLALGTLGAVCGDCGTGAHPCKGEGKGVCCVLGTVQGRRVVPALPQLLPTTGRDKDTWSHCWDSHHQP